MESLYTLAIPWFQPMDEQAGDEKLKGGRDEDASLPGTLSDASLHPGWPDQTPQFPLIQLGLIRWRNCPTPHPLVLRQFIIP